jgi:hypothetical protein
MPLVGFEPTIAVFERAKIVHTLDPAATVIGLEDDNFVDRQRVGRIIIEWVLKQMNRED